MTSTNRALGALVALGVAVAGAAATARADDLPDFTSLVERNGVRVFVATKLRFMQ